MAERAEIFWHHREFEVSSLEGKWFKESVNPDTTDYSMAGELTNDLERTVGNHLVLAGPMVDGYLKQIGSAMSWKLGRNATGLAAPNKDICSMAGSKAPSNTLCWLWC